MEYEKKDSITFFDLPSNILSNEIFSRIHFVHRLEIESTCRLFRDLMPYMDIRALSLDNEIFEVTKFHFQFGDFDLNGDK